MGDMGDYWRDVKPFLKEQSKLKRQSNQENALMILESRGIEYQSKNNGVHLIVSGRNCLIDFYPTTGRFLTRDGRTGRGIRNLLKHCKSEG